MLIVIENQRPIYTMKKIALLFIAAISIMASSCKSTKEPVVITVNNAEELIQALGNDRTIILNNTEGIYWLTEAIDAAVESNYLASLSAYADWEVPNDYNGLLVEEAYDGHALGFYNMKNLTIKGADENEYTKIYVSPRYADVFNFNGCTGITLENLQLGHYPEQGSCAGAVLSFNVCDDVTINNCDLFGCGTSGIEAVMSGNFKVANSIIRDCSESNMWLNDCENFRFFDCKVISENNIVCYGCIGISFENCTVPTTFDDSISFIDCEFFEWPGFVYPEF
jgi:hypothetical protein